MAHVITMMMHAWPRMQCMHAPTSAWHHMRLQAMGRWMDGLTQAHARLVSRPLNSAIDLPDALYINVSSWEQQLPASAETAAKAAAAASQAMLMVNLQHEFQPDTFPSLFK